VGFAESREGCAAPPRDFALGRILNAENFDEVLPRFFHLSKREAQAVAAELRPAESIPLRTVVTSVLLRPPAVDLALGYAGPSLTAPAAEQHRAGRGA